MIVTESELKLEVGKKVWTMVGSRPVELEVMSKYSLSPMIGENYWKVWLWSESRRSTYQRETYQLFKTYEELRDFVFPNLTNK